MHKLFKFCVDFNIKIQELHPRIIKGIERIWKSNFHTQAKSSTQKRMRSLFWLLIFISVSANAQKISGYVYQSDGILPNFKVENVSKGFFVETNQDGKFSISAALGDSIRFSSIAYNTYSFVVEQKNFEETIVVELKTNSLEEVKLTGGKIFKTPVAQLDDQLFKGIQNDIARNPMSYRPGNGNLLEIPRYFARLLFPKKKKEQVNTKATYPLRFEQFEAIFKNDELFNVEFLTNELKIPQEYHTMFFNFLETKEYTSALLEENHTLDFIEKLQESAREYREEVISKQ